MIIGLTACSKKEKSKIDDDNPFLVDDVAVEEETLPDLNRTLTSQDVLNKFCDFLEKADYYDYELRFANDETLTVSDTTSQKTNQLLVSIIKGKDGVTHFYKKEYDGKSKMEITTAYSPYFDADQDTIPLYTQNYDTRIDSGLPMSKNKAKNYINSVNYFEKFAKAIRDHSWGDSLSLVYKDEQYVLVFSLGDFLDLLFAENNQFSKEIKQEFNGFKWDNNSIIKFKLDSSCRLVGVEVDPLTSKSEQNEIKKINELLFNITSVNFDKTKDTFFESLKQSIDAFNKKSGVLLYVPRSEPKLINLTSQQEIIKTAYMKLQNAESYNVSLNLTLKNSKGSNDIKAYAQKQTKETNRTPVFYFKTNLNKKDTICEYYSINYPIYESKNRQQGFRNLFFSRIFDSKMTVDDNIVKDPRDVDIDITDPVYQFLINNLGDSTNVKIENGCPIIEIDYNKFHNIAKSASNNAFKVIIESKEIADLIRSDGIVSIEFDSNGRLKKISMPETKLSSNGSSDEYTISFTCTFSDYNRVNYEHRSDLQPILDEYNENSKIQYALP